MVDGMRTWKAERIARTETMRLWNVGAYARMEAEDEDLIGYEYTVVLDDRTSHTCRPLDGLRVRRGDVQRIPPLHPHCRTVMDPIFSFDEGAGDGRWVGGERIVGAPGFGEAPGARLLVADTLGPPVGRSLPIPDGEARELLSSLKRAEAMIRGDVGQETAVLFVDGVGVAARRAEGMVLGLGDILPQMRGGVLTHNHPSGAAALIRDLALACNGRLSELRVVTKRTTYTLRPGSVEWTSDAYAVELRGRAEAALWSVRQDMKEAGKAFEAEELEEIALRDALWERLAENGHIVYTRSEVTP